MSKDLNVLLEQISEDIEEDAEDEGTQLCGKIGPCSLCDERDECVLYEEDGDNNEATSKASRQDAEQYVFNFGDDEDEGDEGE